MQACLKRKFNDKKYWRDLCWCETRVLNGNWIKENLSSYINTKDKKSDYQYIHFMTDSVRRVWADSNRLKQIERQWFQNRRHSRLREE